jgi:ABC-type branched-subunit amino acid transport system substrate-binding protein
MRLIFLIALVLANASSSYAEHAAQKETTVGVPTLLSGDWAGLGENIVNTVKTYEKYYLRHPIKFVFEDAKISGIDGQKAYQKLINFDHVDALIGATSSNGTMAGASLINSSKTVMITPVTGGQNVDQAGEWIFRLGNSDVLNGAQQAELFEKSGIKRVAVLSEETEYTLDIVRSFESEFKEKNGKIVYSTTFAPATTDFRSQLVALQRSKPSAIFIPTQTGSALALILTQLSQLGGFAGQIHTTFTAADNPDAKALAKGKFNGVFFLAPAYNREDPRLKEFLAHYRTDFNREPLIAFHTAATVDALDLLQAYLDQEKSYSGDNFRAFLLNQVKDYAGLMGRFSFDKNGNANTGFVPAQIN